MSSSFGPIIPPAGGGGGGGSPAWVRETLSVSMPAPVENAGTGQLLEIEVATPGPYFLESILIEQIGGDYAGGTPSLGLSFYCNSARSLGYNGAEFTFPPNVLPSGFNVCGYGYDVLGDNKIYLTLSDNTFSFNTVQYRVFVTLTRPAEVEDNT